MRAVIILSFSVLLFLVGIALAGRMSALSAKADGNSADMLARALLGRIALNVDELMHGFVPGNDTYQDKLAAASYLVGLEDTLESNFSKFNLNVLVGKFEDFTKVDKYVYDLGEEVDGKPQLLDYFSLNDCALRMENNTYILFVFSYGNFSYRKEFKEVYVC